MTVIKGDNELDLNKKIYRCSNCKSEFNWGKNSSWYGSYKQMDENPEKLIYSCSDECMDELKKVTTNE